MQPDHKGISKLSRAVLAKLHIAKKQLCLSDDAYRIILERVTGHSSARDITPDQMPALQREFKRLGWNGYLLTREEWQALDKNYRQDAGATGRAPLKYEELGDRRGMPNPAQLRKLDALFNTTPGYGTINQNAALRAFLKKRFAVEDIRFLNLRQYEVALKAVREIRLRKGLSDDG